MLPQILQQLGSQNLGKIKELMNTIKAAQNPQTAMQVLINKNPQLRQAVELVNQNGGNAEETFYKLAKERGINPEDILSMLR